VNAMPLAGIGAETVEITRRGWYETASGTRVVLADAVARAAAGTRLYRPGDYDALGPPTRSDATGVVEVTGETTAEAARRLVQVEGVRHVAALNFASAKNPGGGFLGGAKAQEEDLARVSALYHCQLTQPAYYAANRRCSSLLYTDHLIYSPAVPFFRDERHELLPSPFEVAILTSPAPNAGASRRGEGHFLRPTLERRAAQVIRVASHHGHRVVVLGAWGCGVFRNEPAVVADVFANLLDGPMGGAFERVVFAIYDRSKSRSTWSAFRERLGRSPVLPREPLPDRNGEKT
jgi:uncharacterized protein (TIGR02452 family)